MNVDKETYEQYAVQNQLSENANNADMSKYLMQLQDNIRENQSMLISQVNPRKVVEEVIHSLQNIEEVEDGVFQKVGEPLMNQEGINHIRFILRGLINQSTTLSHLDETQISKIMMQLSDDITDAISMNWRFYGIRDKAQLDTIIDVIIMPIFMALQRALGQNEKNWLGKISVENISSNKSLQPKKETIWDKFKL